MRDDTAELPHGLELRDLDSIFLKFQHLCEHLDMLPCVPNVAASSPSSALDVTLLVRPQDMSLEA